VQFFAATGEHDVLRAVADQVGGGADAVRRGRAGGGKRIAHAADAEGGREVRGHGRAHRARHHVRADLAHALSRSRSPVRSATAREPPPEPAITPVRGSRTGIVDRPASAIASRMRT
jgi:hypothetical protein